MCSSVISTASGHHSGDRRIGSVSSMTTIRMSPGRGANIPSSALNPEAPWNLVMEFSSKKSQISFGRTRRAFFIVRRNTTFRSGSDMTVSTTFSSTTSTCSSIIFELNQSAVRILVKFAKSNLSVFDLPIDAWPVPQQQ